jgi:hypothetical protein
MQLANQQGEGDAALTFIQRVVPHTVPIDREILAKLMSETRALSDVEKITSADEM